MRSRTFSSPLAVDDSVFSPDFDPPPFDGRFATLNSISYSSVRKTTRRATDSRPSSPLSRLLSPSRSRSSQQTSRPSTDSTDSSIDSIPPPNTSPPSFKTLKKSLSSLNLSLSKSHPRWERDPDTQQPRLLRIGSPLASPIHQSNPHSNYYETDQDLSRRMAYTVLTPTITRDNERVHAYGASAPYPLTYDPSRNQTDLETLRLMATLARGQPSFIDFGSDHPKKVLDVGCGDGSWIRGAAVIWENSFFAGIDLVPPEDEIGRVSWYKRNILQGFPFPGGYFDYVRVSHLSLGIPSDQWETLIHEIKRVSTAKAFVEIIHEGILPIPSIIRDTRSEVLHAHFLNMLTGYRLNEATEVLPALVSHSFGEAHLEEYKVGIRNPWRRSSQQAPKEYQNSSLFRKGSQALRDLEGEWEGDGNEASNASMHPINHQLRRISQHYFDEEKPLLRTPHSPQNGEVIVLHDGRWMALEQRKAARHATYASDILGSSVPALWNYIKRQDPGASRDSFADDISHYSEKAFVRVGLRDPFSLSDRGDESDSMDPRTLFSGRSARKLKWKDGIKHDEFHLVRHISVWTARKYP